MQYKILAGKAFCGLSHPVLPVLLLVAFLSQRYLWIYTLAANYDLNWLIPTYIYRILLFLFVTSILVSSAFTLKNLGSHPNAWSISRFLTVLCCVFGLGILPSVLPDPDTLYIYGFAARIRKTADIPSIRRWARERSFPKTGAVTVKREEWPPSIVRLGAPRYEFEVVNREIRIEYGGGFMIERCGLVIGVDDKATTNSLNRYPERITRKVTRDIQPGVYVWYELINRENP